MIKNYSNQDKKISMKLKKILQKNYTPVENVDDTNLTSNQTDSQADFLGLRIIDSLIRFNQSFRLSQVAIKANIGKLGPSKFLNEFTSDNKFPSSFEALLSAYSLLQNIDRNYRDLRPIFNNLSVPVFNDLNDVLEESRDILKKSILKLNIGKMGHTKSNISYNLDDYTNKLDNIVLTFRNIYNDFKQRKQTFNTNIKTGSGFAYLSKIRNI